MNDQQTSTSTAPTGASQSSDQAQQIFGGAGSDQAQQVQQQPTQDGGAAQTQQGASALTTEQLREIVRTSSAEAVSQAVKATTPQPQLSQEQINQMLNVYSVPPTVAVRLAKALGIDATPEQATELATALNEMLEAKTRQAVTMAAVQIEALKRNDLAALQQQLHPVLNLAYQQEKARLQDEFMTTYPDTKGYEPVLEMIYNDMNGRGVKFNSKDEAFKAVYGQFKAVVAKLPGGSAATGATNAGGNGAARAASSQRMSTVSTGGQTGAGQRGTTMSAQESLARKLFGNS
jgi:signal transduction histidine kinase